MYRTKAKKGHLHQIVHRSDAAFTGAARVMAPNRGVPRIEHTVQWCTKAYVACRAPITSPHHLVEQLTTHSSDGGAVAEQENAIEDTMLGGVRARRDGTRTASRVGAATADTGSTRQCRGRQRTYRSSHTAHVRGLASSWPPTRNGREGANSFCHTAQKPSEATRELLGRLESVSGARCDKVCLHPDPELQDSGHRREGVRREESQESCVSTVESRCQGIRESVDDIGPDVRVVECSKHCIMR